MIAKDKNIQKQCLEKVYTWYFKKLEVIGELSKEDKEEEEMFMNPHKIEEAMKRQEQQKQQKRLNLMNESFIEQKEKKIFDNEERTIHKDIPPAKDRIMSYKKKSLGRLL